MADKMERGIESPVSAAGVTVAPVVGSGVLLMVALVTVDTAETTAL
jgi:hypothetical protein